VVVKIHLIYRVLPEVPVEIFIDDSGYYSFIPTFEELERSLNSYNAIAYLETH
jgi:hypothetical protein